LSHAGDEGVRRLKFHQGKPVIDPETGKPYYEHVYSDLLLIFRLKAPFNETSRRRDLFRCPEVSRRVRRAALVSAKKRRFKCRTRNGLRDRGILGQ